MRTLSLVENFWTRLLLLDSYPTSKVCTCIYRWCGAMQKSIRGYTKCTWTTAGMLFRSDHHMHGLWTDLIIQLVLGRFLKTCGDLTQAHKSVRYQFVYIMHQGVAIYDVYMPLIQHKWHSPVYSYLNYFTSFTGTYVKYFLKFKALRKEKAGSYELFLSILPCCKVFDSGASPEGPNEWSLGTCSTVEANTSEIKVKQMCHLFLVIMCMFEIKK